ncbi:MAG: dTDP-4-dehydrorhamnose 3,5-epimerase [Flavobacteriales bacterium]
MQIEKVDIDGLLIIHPTIFADERGYFYESFNLGKFLTLTGFQSLEFVQDNVSSSKKGVVRGLHFQDPPYEQGKLVNVMQGKVIDVAVDIRKGSPTYGKHYSLELTAENKLLFWIPPGFAHGFVALEDNTLFCYKCTNYYNKASERAIIWNDIDLSIDWREANPILSAKDNEAPVFCDFESKFRY